MAMLSEPYTIDMENDVVGGVDALLLEAISKYLNATLWIQWVSKKS